MNVELSSLIVFIGVLLVSASLHELMHAYVAYQLGDDLAHSQGRISLNPLVHIDPVLTIGLPVLLIMLGQSPILAAKPVPINTSRLSGGDFGMALVGISGPFTNLILAFVGGTLFTLLAPTGIVREVVEMFIQVNISLFVFNMLPIPPLDGSRALYAIAPEPVQRVMAQIESYGIFGLIVLLMLAGQFISPLLETSYNIILNLVL